MEAPSPRAALAYSDASGSPRTATSKKEKKHKKDKKDKETKRAHRKSRALGAVEGTAVEASPLTQSTKPSDRLELGWGEHDLLKRRLDDLGSLTPIQLYPPYISCGAIGRFLCNTIDGEQVDLALALVALGADINCLHPTRKISALTIAAELGDTEAIKCASSNTPRFTLFRLLSAAGARQQVEGAQESPIDAAKRVNKPQIVRLLQSLSA